MEPTPEIPFIDLVAQRGRIADRIDAAISRVIAHGRYVLGPEVTTFESRLASFCGVKHAIGCASGTDSLLLSLLAKGVRPGHGVCVPAFGFAACAEVVALLGAIPVFADVSADTFNLAPESLARACEIREPSLVGVIAMDLFGQPATYGSICKIAEDNGLFVIADCAQSLGATLDGQRTGVFGDIAATSFYPAKPLGCYGDGGAVLTNDESLASAARSLRDHGQGAERYDHVRIGTNSRLDTLQAAILLEKLAIFEDEISARQGIANCYTKGLADVMAVPQVATGASSVWAQYTVCLDNRDSVAARLRAAGVPTAVHYPRVLNGQPAFRDFPVAPGGVPVAEMLTRRVLSLPMHPYLDMTTQNRIISTLRAAVA